MMSLSQVAIAIGGSYSQFYMMLVGRAMFGVSSDMLFISISKVLSQHLEGDLGLALGLVLTIPEVAAALNSFLSPLLFQKSGSLTLPLIFGLSICLVSFACGIGVIYLDTEIEAKKARAGVIAPKEQEEPPPETTKIQLNEGFLLLMCICTLSISVYIPFLDNVNKFYQERFGWNQVKSGRIVMIGYIISAIASPFTGKISDKWSNRRKPLIFLTTVLFLASHLQFLLLKQGTQQVPNHFSIFGYVLDLFYIRLVTLGLAYSFYSSVLIPALSTTLPEQYFATALGILGVGENIFLAGVPILTAYVYGELDKERRLKAVDFIYLTMASISVLLSLRVLLLKNFGHKNEGKDKPYKLLA